MNLLLLLHYIFNFLLHCIYLTVIQLLVNLLMMNYFRLHYSAYTVVTNSLTFTSCNIKVTVPIHKYMVIIQWTNTVYIVLKCIILHDYLMLIHVYFYLSKMLNARLLLVFIHCNTSTFTSVPLQALTTEADKKIL